MRGTGPGKPPLSWARLKRSPNGRWCLVWFVHGPCGVRRIGPTIFAAGAPLPNAAPGIKMPRMDPTAESELIRRCRGGDGAAWEELFERHFAATGRFVFQLAHDMSREDVEEICQEVFLSVIKNLQSFQGLCKFQTWVFRIAANKARDFRQRRHAAKRGGGQTTIPLQTGPDEEGMTVDPPSVDPGPDEALMSAERMVLLQGALGELGEPCREIIELRYFGDLSYEELSGALHLNQKTVSSRLSKCLDRLEVIARRVFLGRKPAPSPSNQAGLPIHRGT